MDKLPVGGDQEVQRIKRSQKPAVMPRVVEAQYDGEKKRIVVELDNDYNFAFPTDKAPELAKATAAMLTEVSIVNQGDSLRWPTLGADLRVQDLLDGLLGLTAGMREMGRKGGAVTSKAKRAAAQVNGRKGGRPGRNNDKQVMSDLIPEVVIENYVNA